MREAVDVACLLVKLNWKQICQNKFLDKMTFFFIRCTNKAFYNCFINLYTLLLKKY